MADIPSLLLEYLNKLSQDNFERFKMFLSSTGAEGYSHIGRKHLEDAKHHKIVQLMKDKHGPSEAARITVQILKKLQQDSLAADLEKQLAGGQAEVAEVDRAPSSSASSSASSSGVVPQVSQVITADQCSNVKAHLVIGGNFSGPVTFN